MHRKTLRDAVAQALTGVVRFAGFEMIPAFVQGIDEETLPVIGVLTPGEQSRRVADDLLARTVDLLVILKRRGGGDIQDVMDADAVAIEAAVAGAIDAICINWHLRQTQMQISGEGGTRAGSIVLSYSILIHTDA